MLQEPPLLHQSLWQLYAEDRYEVKTPYGRLSDWLRGNARTADTATS